MDASRRGIQILGWLSLIAGYALALFLIRAIFIGISRGFSAVRSQAFWIVLGYLLAFSVAVYLCIVGRRALSVAKGNPQPRARFGWGRMLLGAGLLFSAATTHFHLLPTRDVVKPLEYSNPTQAAAGIVTTIIIYVGCVFLIVWGIGKGLRRPAA